MFYNGIWGFCGYVAAYLLIFQPQNEMYGHETDMYSTSIVPYLHMACWKYYLQYGGS